MAQEPGQQQEQQQQGAPGSVPVAGQGAHIEEPDPSLAGGDGADAAAMEDQLSQGGLVGGEGDADADVAGPSSQAAAGASQANAAGAPTLDDLLALAESCGTNHKLVQSSLRPMLNRAVKAQRAEGVDVFVQPLSSGQDPLALLDPSVHSLMLLHVLTARIKAVRTEEAISTIVPLCETFAAQADVVQLRFAPDRVNQLGYGIIHLADLLREPAWGLNVLCTLFQRYVADARILSSLHVNILYMCLKAGAYEAAFQTALRVPIEEVIQQTSPVRYSDVLQYFYYAGLLAAKQNLFDAALDYLEQCVTMPAKTISAIQVDANKKLMLVQLLHHGKVPALPAYTSPAVSKGLLALCRPYIAFAKAYEDRAVTSAEVYHKADEIKELAQRDQNWGLLQQCLARHRSRTIQRLASTYSCISVADVARLVGSSDDPQALAAIRDEIVQMIEAGWIDAELDHIPLPSAPTGTDISPPPQPIVRFHSATGEGRRDRFASAPSLATLQGHLLEAQRWKTALEERERALARSGVFLHKQMLSGIRDAGSGEGPGGPGGGVNGLDPYGMPVDDEEFEDDAFAP